MARRGGAASVSALLWDSHPPCLRSHQPCYLVFEPLCDWCGLRKAPYLVSELQVWTELSWIAFNFTPSLPTKRTHLSLLIYRRVFTQRQWPWVDVNNASVCFLSLRTNRSDAVGSYLIALKQLRAYFHSGMVRAMMISSWWAPWVIISFVCLVLRALLSSCINTS